MKIWQILIASSLMAASGATLATGGSHYWSHWHNNCGGGGGGDCIVTWDFTTTAGGNGDPLPPYTGSDSAYSLVIQGFAIKQANGMVVDRAETSSAYSGDYATDYDGSDYGIGVHAEGEGNHWGTKIDNKVNDWEDAQWAVRDAVLMDFGSCMVSIDQIDLIKVYDTDFELWAFTGAIDNTQTLEQLGDYDNWTAAIDGDNFELIDNNWSTERGSHELQAVINGSSTSSRYFILIAGGDKYDAIPDAFRMAGLKVTCDPNNCEPSGGPGVPVPGTLALLAIGALATRRRLRKES